MNKKSFDYIYDLLFLYDEEDYWLECKGFGQLQGYLENLNEEAFKALIGFSESWSHSFRLNIAEVIIESSIESNFEIYCKMFIAMEDESSAHWMSGRLEDTGPADFKSRNIATVSRKDGKNRKVWQTVPRRIEW